MIFFAFLTTEFALEPRGKMNINKTRIQIP